MRMVLQRVKQASVSVQEQEVAAIGPGLLALVGFGLEDDDSLPGSKSWSYMLKKLLELRIFPDQEGKLNTNVCELSPDGGDILLVSQFTLYADCRKGRRPSFTASAPPDLARMLFTRFAEDVRHLWPDKVQTGRFGEEMDVSLTNWGPVTIILDSQNP